MKRKLNLVQKFRKFYFALPKDEQGALWDIMTALRSEDNGSFRLKLFTTSRIRGALLGKSVDSFLERAISFARLEKAKSYSNQYSWSRISQADVMPLYNKATYHFRIHFQSAIKALKKYGFKGTISDLKRFL